MMNIVNYVQLKLNRCSYCHFRSAVWYYMPGTWQACDKCVPRGCSCNLIFEIDDFEVGVEHPEYRDELGRKLPCCEWWNLDESQ